MCSSFVIYIFQISIYIYTYCNTFSQFGVCIFPLFTLTYTLTNTNIYMKINTFTHTFNYVHTHSAWLLSSTWDNRGNLWVLWASWGTVRAHPAQGGQGRLPRDLTVLVEQEDGIGGTEEDKAERGWLRNPGHLGGMVPSLLLQALEKPT